MNPYISPCTLTLHGTWTLTSLQYHNQHPIEIAMTIPGDTASALLQHNVIPDPYYADNEHACQWIGMEPWKISREFSVSYDLLQHKHIRLRMNFVDTFAHVFINDTPIGHTTNMFDAYTFDVKKHLREGTNRIHIIFDSPVETATRRSKKLPFPIPATQNYPQHLRDAHINLIRKTQCHGGWDWGITLMVSGIYGDLSLNGVHNTVIEYVRHTQVHNKNTVSLTLTADVYAYNNASHTIHFSFNDSTQTITKSLTKGSNTISCTFKISDPVLWFPAGYGAPHCYDLQVSTDDGAAYHQKIGLRAVQIINKKDTHGISFVVRVNGIDVFCKGANWIPCDALPARQTADVYRRLLTDAVDVHMNMLRVWGGGQYEKDEFYDLCDELGILVWHDLMFACSLYPSEAWFLDEVRSETIHQIKRLQHHPCIVLWCGDNEVIGAISWYPESRNNRDRYIANYVKLNMLLEEVCTTIDSTRTFWPSSPCGGTMDFGDSWHDDSSGDMHYWDVWHAGRSFDAYYTIKPRFCSEFGFQSFPSLPTVNTYAHNTHHNITAPNMEHHQKNKKGNSIILEMFSRYFKIPMSFEQQVYLSQVQQALAMQMGIEYWRTTRPVCMGTLYWQLNDNWPVASWSSIDYYGRWKLLHYQAKRSYDPVLVTMQYKNNICEVWAVNDTLQAHTIPLVVRVLAFDGTVISTDTVSPYTVDPQSAACMYTFPVSFDLTTYFVWSSYTHPISKATQHRSLVCAPYKSCEIQTPAITSHVAQDKDQFIITLSTDVPAFFVVLEQYQDIGTFDDNMISLLPHHPHMLSFTPKSLMSVKKFQRGLKLFHL